MQDVRELVFLSNAKFACLCVGGEPIFLVYLSLQV